MSSALTKAAGVSATATLILCFAAPARAESWMVDGTVALGTGLEGADPGGGGVEWQRARTRIITGFDLRTDEVQQESMGVRAFAELEQSGGIGGEVRYSRWLGSWFGGYVHLTGTVAPETLFGAGVGGTFVLPVGRRFGFALEPAFAALPLGSDLPGDSVLLWATLSLGVRVGL